MRCEIDDARLFLQVLRERRDALEVLREALSNSYDAGATHARVIVQNASGGHLNLEVHDNGRGIRPQEFRFFFGLGFGNKAATPNIGNKGLGTKLFFNSARVEVATRPSRRAGYEAVLDRPLATLERGRVPRYLLKWSKHPPVRFTRGTSVYVRGLKASANAPSLSGENIANYLRWYTVAGSCHRLLQAKSKRRMSVRLVREGVRRSEFRISGHELPRFDASVETDYQSFAREFDPFRIELCNDDGRNLGRLEIAGAIVGPGGHVVKDRRIKKRFKGLFLAKDYFIVRSINSEVFGGTGEWQNMHIVANCQQLELSMNRDDFIDTGAGSVYEEVLAALHAFVNAVRRGQPFAYRGQIVEPTAQFAGACYTELKNMQQVETRTEHRNLRTLDLLTMSSASTTPLANDGGPVYEPIDTEGVMLLFQALISKNQVFRLNRNSDSRVHYRVLGHSGGASGNLVVQKRQGRAWSSPLFYKPVLRLEGPSGRGLSDVNGIVCWELERELDERYDGLDVVILKEQRPT